jgi:hypothetical protein
MISLGGLKAIKLMNLEPQGNKQFQLLLAWIVLSQLFQSYS